MTSQPEQSAHSPRLEAVIQKLEESLLRSDDSSGENALTARGDGLNPVSTRIRRIITSNLSEQPAGKSSQVGELEESRALRDQLSPGQADPDQLQAKQSSLADRLDQMLQSGESDQDSASLASLQLHNMESSYRQKLHAYHEAQQKQAQLVQKLQTKVLQYKRRCGELEDKVLEKTSDSEKIRLLLQVHLDSAQRQQRTEQDLNLDIQTKSAQLQEEQKRCVSLTQVNSVLREQLEQAEVVNRELTESLWKAREDAESCETRLRREQETCASRLTREQARVRALWRQATSLRSTFTQLRTFTDRTLSDMRGECVGAIRQLHFACQNVEAKVNQESSPGGVEAGALERQLKDKLKEAMQIQGRWDAEKVELNSRIQELTETVKDLRGLNCEKDASLSTMQMSLDRMETRSTEDKAEMEVLQAEIQAFKQIVSHVHQLVGCEGDSDASERMSPPPLHGSSSLRNTTVLAVQNLLSKHHKQSQEVHERLDAALEQVDSLRDLVQTKEAEGRELEQKVLETKREAKMSLEETLKNSSRYRCSLEHISSEKGSLEKLVSELQREVDSQFAELEALRGSSQDLQRQRDLLRQQREDVEMQLARQRTEAQRGERSLKELEGKHSDLRRELVMAKEALSQVTLQKEVLEDDKASLTLALNKMESQSSAHELALTKLQTQEAALKDSLAKMAALSEGLAKDKVELSRILLQTEAEKAELSERRRDAEMERTAAREETARVQQDLMNLLAEKQVLERTHSHLQDLCQKLEAELSLQQKEKTQAVELRSQVNRQMQSVSEELCACRRELETQTTALKRATHDREGLAKDKAALDVKLNAADRNACGLTQELLALRAEKESLETDLFESQELASSLEAECSRMEAERRSLLLANEALTRDGARSRADAECQLAQATKEQNQLEKKLAQVERDAMLHLSKEQSHREQLEAECRQKEQQCSDLKVQWEQAEEQLRRQCEELHVRDQKELQLAQEELARQQQHFNQSLLQAENEKQQTLSKKEAEKVALTEQLAALQQDLAAADMRLEQVLREAQSKQEQDKNTIAVHLSELQDLRTQFEESLNSHENREKFLTEQVRELNQHRESTQQEIEGLRRQLHEAEEGLVKVRKELIEAHRELQECAQDRDKQRQEALDLRRLLCDETREKEAIQTSNSELRALIKHAESENSSLRRAAEEREQKVAVLEECKSSMHQEAAALRSSLRELEKSGLQARRQLQELRRQVKVLERENSRQKQELQELQARLCQEEQREEEARQEAFTLKQRVLECEAGRDAALNEVAGLQHRLLELEAAERHNQELLQEKHTHQQQCEQKYRETTTQLGEELEDARIQSKELSVQVGLAETKVRGLEEQLGLVDAKRMDLESKLAGLCSVVCHTVGTSHSRSSHRRSPSAWRKHLHVKDEELDLDSIHTVLREFQQKLRDTQRDRDDAKAQVVHLNEQVTELQASQDKSATQLLQLHKCLKQSEQEKRVITEHLQEAQRSCSLQEEVLRCSEREKKSLQDEAAQFRISLHAAEAESRTLHDKVGLLQGSESRANVEKQKLAESLEAAENKVSQLELSQRSLEGELLRARLRTAELDAETGALWERLTDLRRRLGESEDRCAALKVNEDTSAKSLTRAEQHESQLRDQIHKLSNALSHNRMSSGALQEQNTQLQKALAASEQDRRLLQEHLDKMRDALSESKRRNHKLTEQTQTLQQAQEHLEQKGSELEKHSSTLKESLKQQQEAELQTLGNVKQLQQEKEELQDKVTKLQASLQKLQSERVEMERALTRLGKDKSALRRTLEKVELERLRREEEASSAAREQERLEEMVRGLERELAEKHNQQQAVQVRDCWAPGMGPYFSTGEVTCTTPPGGGSPPSPGADRGADRGDGPSAGQTATSRAGAGDQGEGSSSEGQMPGGAVAECEKAAGSGDRKTTEHFQSAAPAWHVGREAAVTDCSSCSTQQQAECKESTVFPCLTQEAQFTTEGQVRRDRGRAREQSGEDSDCRGVERRIGRSCPLLLCSALLLLLQVCVLLPPVAQCLLSTPSLGG